MQVNSNTIIKKSPIIIVLNFVGIQFAAFGSYILAASLGHYAKLYRTLPWADTISFNLAQAIFIFSAEVFLCFFIFFQWYKDYIVINPEKITHSKGILWQNKTILPISQIRSVSFKQNPFGRLVKYGTLEFQTESENGVYKIKYISEPSQLAETILKLKKTHYFNNQSQDNIAGATLAMAENKNLEFKSTLRWDLKAAKINKDLEKSAVKTIAAFLNTEGGTLVIGASDDKEIIGVAEDYSTLNKKDADGFENHLTNLIHGMIGPEFSQLIKISWHKENDKEYCKINVNPSHKPAYVTSDDKEEFFIRTGNNTTSLKISAANSYIQDRF